MGRPTREERQSASGEPKRAPCGHHRAFCITVCSCNRPATVPVPPAVLAQGTAQGSSVPQRGWAPVAPVSRWRFEKRRAPYSNRALICAKRVCAYHRG